MRRSKANGDEGEGCLRTEAAFGRKRAAAVSEAAAASPAKRARMMAEMPWLQPGVGWDCALSRQGFGAGPRWTDGTGERFLLTSFGLSLGIPFPPNGDTCVYLLELLRPSRSGARAGTPSSEAARGRKSSDNHLRVFLRPPPGADDEPVEAAPACAAAAAKRAAQETRRRGAAGAVQARAKREAHVVQPLVRRPEDATVAASAALPAGFLLALPSDRPARRVAQKLGFHILDDPVDFARKVGEAARRKGHVVLAPVCEDTDYSVCARLCAVCLGAYLADSQAFCRKGRSCGVQYEDLCHGGGQGFKVAVSARLASRMPTLPLLLRALAEVPRGSFAFYSEHRLRKVFRKAKTSREVLKMAILSLLPDRATADKKVQGVYRTVAAFSAQHAVVKSGAGCPGHP